MRKEKQKRTNFCPECGGEAYIIDTRPSAKHKGLTRRRSECVKCGYRFSTIEVLEDRLEMLETENARLERQKNILDYTIAEVIEAIRRMPDEKTKKED